jgi:hypothetical protein
VKRKFDILAHQQEVGSDQGSASIINWLDRDPVSLMNRFQKTIGKQVQYWNKYYKQVKDTNPSGWTEADYIAEACTIYAKVEGKPFQQSHTVPILHRMPKWKPIKSANGWSDEIDEDLVGEDDEEDDSNKKMPARVNKFDGEFNVQRPTGTKKFKREVAEAASVASAATSYAEATDTLASSIQGLSGSLSGYFKSKEIRNERKDTMKEYLRLCDLYIKIGDMEEARKYADKAKQLREQQENTMTPVVPPGSTSTPLPPSVIRTRTAEDSPLEETALAAPAPAPEPNDTTNEFFAAI